MKQSIRALIILAAWNCLSAKTDKLCLIKSDEGCERCEYSYLDPETKFCVADIKNPVDHCKRYKREGDIVSCIACDDGYGLGDKKECIACTVSNCYACPRDNCFWCLGGLVYSFVHRQCVKHSGVGIDNCEIMGLDRGDYSSCLKCAQGFSKLTSNGGACFKGPEGCSKVNDDKKCDICHSGYFMDNNRVCRKRDSMTESIEKEEPEGDTRILGMRNKDLLVTVCAVVAVLALILILRLTVCRRKHSPAQPEGVEIAL
jgi:hypothetical protein